MQQGVSGSTRTPNIAVDRTAGSHSLAAAGHLRPAGPGVWSARRPQALPVQLGQLPKEPLQFLPGRHSYPHGWGQRLRDVVPLRAALGPPEAHVEMRPVLLPLVTVAPRSPAGPVRFGERAEQDLRSEPLEPTQQGVARPVSGHNRCHPLRLSRDTHCPVKKKRCVWTSSRGGDPPTIRGKAAIFAPESS